MKKSKKSSRTSFKGSKEYNTLVKTKLKKILKSKRDKKDDPNSSDSEGSSSEEWPAWMDINPDLGGDHGGVTSTTMASLRALEDPLYVLFLDIGCSNTQISSKYSNYLKSVKKLKIHIKLINIR